MNPDEILMRLRQSRQPCQNEPDAEPGVSSCREVFDSYKLARCPKVSIHMLTYNHEKYIGEAIEGVVNQECDFDYELVIGEDCSSDRTREICFEYQKKYPKIIRVLCSEQNVGMQKNYARVSATLRGQYIAFCEGDDFWFDKYKLQRQVDFLDNNPEYGLVCSALRRIIEGEAITELKGDFKDHDLKFDDLFLGNSIPTVSVCMRATIFSEYFERVWPMFANEVIGDYPCWLWSALRTKLRMMAKSMETYRILIGSVSHSSDIRSIVRFEISCMTIIVAFFPFASYRMRELRTLLFYNMNYIGRCNKWLSEETRIAFFALFKKHIDTFALCQMGLLSLLNRINPRLRQYYFRLVFRVLRP